MFLIIVFVPIYSSIAIWFIIAFVNQQILLEISQIPKKIEWCKMYGCENIAVMQKQETAMLR